MNSCVLPRAPVQKYVDVYRDNPAFLNDKNQQFNYEAEVKVYRALERIQEKIVVLHNLEYSHFQYHLGDTDHDKRKCLRCKRQANDKEGETDFIAIGDGYFVIIEVKNILQIGEKVISENEKGEHSEKLLRTFRKAAQQRTKMTDLIKRTCPDAIVFEFTAYPFFDKEYKHEFDKLNQSELSTLILKEDVFDLVEWWEERIGHFMKENPTSCPENCTRFEETRNLLLALWSTDNKGQFDISKCSLGKCVSEVDSKLISGKFTLRGNNPNVVSTPEFVRDYLGVENLSKEQNDTLNSRENFKFLNGPAGSGKTLVMLAKTLQLARKNDDKIILFQFAVFRQDSPSDNIKKHQEVFTKAGIKHSCITIPDNMEEPALIVHNKILNSLSESQVVIVSLWGINYLDDQKDDTGEYRESLHDWVTNLIVSFKEQHVFIDDLQIAIGCGGVLAFNYNFLLKLKDLSENHVIWLTCDIVQSINHCDRSWDNLFYKNITEFLETFASTSDEINCFSENLRNTYDISQILFTIRKRIIKNKMRHHTLGTGCNMDFIFPPQAPGHYIHGPVTTFHVLQNFDEDLITNFFLQELKIISQNDEHPIDLSEIGLIYACEDSATVSLVEKLQTSFLPSDVWIWPLIKLYSQEWPAVVILMPLHDPLFEYYSTRLCALAEGELYQVEDKQSSSDLETLYLAISRARVKCTVIMYPLIQFDFSAYHLIDDILDELSDLILINRWDYYPADFRPRPPENRAEIESYLQKNFRRFVFPPMFGYGR